MSKVSLFLSAACYEGRAQAQFMRSLLALREACATRGVGLHLELSGGEALASRGRAGALLNFLESEASHLLLASAEHGFAPDDVFELLASGEPVCRRILASDAEARENPGEAPQLMLIAREAALRVAVAHPELHAGLGDLRGAGSGRAPMVFESMIEPGTGRYVVDLEAFWVRWDSLRDREGAQA